MTKHIPVSLGIAAISALIASPALAELSVDDAWAVWQRQITSIGLAVEAEENRLGNSLQIGTVTVSANFPADVGRFSFSFAGPLLEAIGDGTVRVTLPESSTMSLSGSITGEGSLTAEAEIVSKNSVGIMSGTPERVVSNWSGDSSVLTLTSLDVDGDVAVDPTAVIRMGAFTFDTITTFGETSITVEQTARYDGYEMDFDYEFSADGSTFGSEGSGQIDGMELNQTLVMPVGGIDIMALPAQLRDGLRVDSRTTAEYYEVRQATLLDGQPITDQITKADGYSQSLRIDQNGLFADGEVGAYSTELAGSQIPFPVAMTGQSASGHFLMPLLAAAKPQPAQFRMDMQGLTLNDEIWSLFDAEGQLPRDPMALTIDLDGALDVIVDLVDFETLQKLDSATGLVLPVSADLNSFLLSAVGAELTGDGAFTFDARDYETFPGMPRPEGAVSLTLTGANALLDKLVEMGLMPEDQAMGTRMMMGMFTVPGDVEDQLKSYIEINGEGHVLANDQRLR